MQGSPSFLVSRHFIDLDSQTVIFELCEVVVNAADTSTRIDIELTGLNSIQFVLAKQLAKHHKVDQVISKLFAQRLPLNQHQQLGYVVLRVLLGQLNYFFKGNSCPRSCSLFEGEHGRVALFFQELLDGMPRLQSMLTHLRSVAVTALQSHQTSVHKRV